MSGLYDTFLNVVAFAFIGLLIWLYVTDFSKGEERSSATKPDRPEKEDKDG